MNKTFLHDKHLALGAKMTDFHGWDMPLYYTSILDEHRAVRDAVGLFDISHMGQVLVTGPDAMRTLDHLTVSDLSRVGIGRACYSLMLNEQGGILDDIIIYRLGDDEFLVIVNCAMHAADVAWLQAHRQGHTSVTDISDGRSMIAVQGPKAARLLESLMDAKVAGLGRFEIAPIRTMSPDACIARTGYTGSDGFELFLPNAHAVRLWEALVSEGKALGVLPVGLGARDTLRIEAGLRLYGTDMDATTTPWQAGLDWTVAMTKPQFIGKDALARQRAQGLTKKFVGFMLAQGPVPRTGMELATGATAADAHPVGHVTSGTFSLMLQKPIGMGYVETAASTLGTSLWLTVRAQRYCATVVKLPFWKPDDFPDIVPVLSIEDVFVCGNGIL